MSAVSPMTVGLILGVAVAVAGLVSWRMPAPERATAASLSVAAKPSGELELAPRGHVIAAPRLRAGEAVRGELAVRNQTGRTLAVRLRAVPSGRDLDRVLQVEAKVGGKPLFRGTLGALRSFTRRSFRAAPGERRRLDLRAWIPSSARSGWRGRAEDVVLELRPRPLGGSR